MAYALSGVDLGNITKESHKVTSSLDVFNFPASGTKDAEAFDFGDTRRTINLQGSYSTTSVALLMTWIQSMNDLQNGSQDTVTFHSDLWQTSTSHTNGNFLVKVEDFSFDYEGGSPLVIKYTLSLVESV